MTGECNNSPQSAEAPTATKPEDFIKDFLEPIATDYMFRDAHNRWEAVQKWGAKHKVKLILAATVTTVACWQLLAIAGVAAASLHISVTAAKLAGDALVGILGLTYASFQGWAKEAKTKKDDNKARSNQIIAKLLCALGNLDHTKNGSKLQQLDNINISQHIWMDNAKPRETPDRAPTDTSSLQILERAILAVSTGRWSDYNLDSPIVTFAPKMKQYINACELSNSDRTIAENQIMQITEALEKLNGIGIFNIRQLRDVLSAVNEAFDRKAHSDKAYGTLWQHSCQVAMGNASIQSPLEESVLKSLRKHFHTKWHLMTKGELLTKVTGYLFPPAALKPNFAPSSAGYIWDVHPSANRPIFDITQPQQIDDSQSPPVSDQPCDVETTHSWGAYWLGWLAWPTGTRNAATKESAGAHKPVGNASSGLGTIEEEKNDGIKSSWYKGETPASIKLAATTCGYGGTH